MPNPSEWSRPRRVLSALALLALVALAWWSVGAFFDWASGPSRSLVEE
jgi:hypothetical protein